MRFTRTLLVGSVAALSLASFLFYPLLDRMGAGRGLALAASAEKDEPPESVKEHACHEPDDKKAKKHDCFTSLGPTHFAGRVRALAVRPDDQNTIWAATASGGLWFTHDAGATWGHISDFLPTLSFSSLAID